MLATALLFGGALSPVLVQQQTAYALTAGDAVDLRVLLIGGAGGGTTDPVTAAWAAGLSSQGVAYTEIDASGGIPAQVVTLPTLTSSPTHGLFNAVVFAGKPADFAAGQLTALFSYESTFGIRQIDGNFVPGYPSGTTVGLNAVTDAQTGAGISSTTSTLTAAGLTTFAALNGPVPIDVSSFGSPATAATPVPTGATETPLLNDASGNVLVGVYQHPTAAQAPTDLQAGVEEMTIGVNYNPNQSQWLLLGPGLIDWVTGASHLGLYRNYSTVHVDDVFSANDAWNTTTHANDYSPANALRLHAVDVDTAATWSRGNNFRLDTLFSGGDTTAYQAAHGGTDPLLAEFQKTDPATAKPYTQDFGWLNHTWDHASLDVGCATTNYIEAEVQQNTNWAASAPGAAAGTGGLGLTSSTDTSLAAGTENPTALVPGGHSGFANLVPGSAASVDPPNLDSVSLASGGTLASGSYQWAVTDQFNGADAATVDESAAAATAPILISVGQHVALQWRAVCHAANYLVYREVAGSNNWSLVGNIATPASATPPATVTADPTGGSTTDTTGGGLQQLAFADNGAAGTAQPAGWTPPTAPNAHEMAWEQNPNFGSAMQALNMTSVGTDGSEPYPNPASSTFGIGVNYAGASYPANAAFPDGTFEGVPRHPINLFYNTSTETQAVDEYNHIYAAPPLGTCVNSATTTCLTIPATFADIVNSVASGMFTNMVNNDPRPSYVHQSNLMGVPPSGPPTTSTPPPTSTAAGDGLFYSVLNTLLATYHTYYNATVPYQQPTMGAIGTVLNEQTLWAAAQPAGSANTTNTVAASETDGTITLKNNGTVSIAVPVTVPLGYGLGGVPFGNPYGGSLSAWQTLTPGQSITISALPPAVTSAATANAQVGSPFTFAITTSGLPAPTLSETGTLPSGLTYMAGATGSGAITGTPAAGDGGYYSFMLTATNGSGVATQSFSLFIANPSIAVLSSSNPPSYAVAGTPITYSYKVTNTGNVPLIAVGVTDTLAGLSPIICPNSTLLTAANETCTAGQTATQADVDAGAIADAVTASGTGLTAGVAPLVVHAAATVTTPSIQSPAIAVAPTATPGAFFAAGIPITFDYLVTNSGNVTLHSVGVTDTLAGMSPITCPNPTLVAAGTETCIAFYTTTAHDVRAGHVTDPATANGMTPAGAAVHGSSSVLVPLRIAPTITSAELSTVPRFTNVHFKITATGLPAPLLTLTGTLPHGLAFASGSGSAMLTGTVNAAGTYKLTLTATSSAGMTHQHYTLHVTAPELASDVSAKPGNASATVKWVPPVLHGGLPVTGYIVTPYLGHHALASHTFHSTANHQVITDLTNGRQYTFTITVINKLGAGSNSSTTSQINALGVGPTSPASAPIRIGTPTAPAAASFCQLRFEPTIPGTLNHRDEGAAGNGSR